MRIPNISQRKQSEITINVIMVIVITIISIGMLIGIFSTKLPTFSKSIYCKTFFYVHSATFVPKAVRQDQNYCLETKLLAPPVIVSDDTPLDITLLGHMAACWQKADYGKYNKNLLCFELTMGPKITQPVPLTEKGLTKILVENNMCDVFSNNDFMSDVDDPVSCGDRDDIVWEIVGDQINPEQNILVEYVDRQIRVS